MNSRRRRRLRHQRAERARRQSIWRALERLRPAALTRYDHGPVVAHVDFGITWYFPAGSGFSLSEVAIAPAALQDATIPGFDERPPEILAPQDERTRRFLQGRR